jgi:DNA adenine methylase
MCKPVIKWVGGKRQLLNELKQYMPKKFNTYFEPFIGGGALFFDLKIEKSFINDYNSELTNLYEIIKNYPEELIQDLEKHKNDSDYFYKIRELDRTPEKYKKISKIKKASRFIYLNKTGFNGLYRVNKSGQFNVPFGRYKNPNYADKENILACSNLLQHTTILNGDFEIIKEYIQKGDFVYLDPPYVPLNGTSSFTEYTDKGFDEDTQFRLKELCDYINSIGAYFMLSNSYTDYIKNLYKDYNLITVQANRALNCKATGRGKINEYIVINYKINKGN